MPSPFPGMDPFIEGQKWKDFHTALLLEIHRELVAAVRPRYVVEVEEYVLTKRHNVLASPANLVEIDLLRGGPRLPTTEPLPDGNYFGFVSRHARFPEVEVFAWSLRDALPNLPIPLAEGEPDAVVNLQAAFTRAYDDGGYDYSLDYTAELSPPAAESDARWIEEVVRSKGA